MGCFQIVIFKNHFEYSIISVTSIQHCFDISRNKVPISTKHFANVYHHVNFSCAELNAFKCFSNFVGSSIASVWKSNYCANFNTAALQYFSSTLDVMVRSA